MVFAKLKFELPHATTAQNRLIQNKYEIHLKNIKCYLCNKRGDYHFINS